MKKYVIIVKSDEEGLHIERINNGFNALELIAVTNLIKDDLVKTFMNNLIPDKSKIEQRKRYIEDGKVHCIPEKRKNKSKN